MNSSLEQVQDLLRLEVSPLDEKAAELESALAKINTDRKRLRAALAVLEGGTAKTKTKSTRKCVTKDIVIQLMEQVLRETGSMALEDLNQSIRSGVKNLDTFRNHSSNQGSFKGASIWANGRRQDWDAESKRN